MPFYYELEPKDKTDRRIAQKLLKLREVMAAEVPERTLNESLLLATWNIREFDSSKYGERSKEALYYIAEIISHFDIVAVQEVNADLKALRDLMEILGDWWEYIITDVTAGTAGNRERGAFVYDSRKVKFGGLSGEIVVPPKGKMEPAEQLARTPFVCGFEAGWLRVEICSVHIYYGQSKAFDPKRLKEIQWLSDFLAARVGETEAWARNLVLLGDFNVFATKDQTFKAIEKNFFIPPQFKELTSNASRNRHFDQMGFTSRAFDADYVREHLKTFPAGVFDFFNHVYTDEEEKLYAPQIGQAYKVNKRGEPRTDRQKRNYYRQWRTFQMSDHFPMWIELKVDYGKPYLESIAKGGGKVKFD